MLACLFWANCPAFKSWFTLTFSDSFEEITIQILISSFLEDIQHAILNRIIFMHGKCSTVVWCGLRLKQRLKIPLYSEFIVSRQVLHWTDQLPFASSHEGNPTLPLECKLQDFQHHLAVMPCLSCFSQSRFSPFLPGEWSCPAIPGGPDYSGCPTITRVTWQSRLTLLSWIT